MNPVLTFIAGLVFGLGLIVSGMVNPAKVLGFLDLVRPWDPSLALVMLAAVTVASVGFAFASRRNASLLGLPMQLPATRPIDRKLVSGSLVFGIGWGLAGICPGPALVLVGTGAAKGAIFVLCMLTGLRTQQWCSARFRSAATSVPGSRASA